MYPSIAHRTSSNTPLLLALATVVCAAVAIAATPDVAGWRTLHLVFKPLTSLLVLAYAMRRGHDTPVARRWILAGLALSSVGDVALMWPERGFLPGLVSFLLAHLAYLVAFTRAERFASWIPPFAFYGFAAGAVLTVLWPALGSQLRGPVIAYIACLASMAAQAAVIAWRRRRNSHSASERIADRTGYARRALILGLGGALWVLSDSMLAIDRFLTPIPLGAMWILTSYWLAQWLVASWLTPPPR